MELQDWNILPCMPVHVMGAHGPLCCAQERANTQGNNSSGVGCISEVATLNASEGQQPPAKRARPCPSPAEVPAAAAAAAVVDTAAVDAKHGPGEGPIAGSVRRRVGQPGYARIRDVLAAQSSTLHQQVLPALLLCWS